MKRRMNKRMATAALAGAMVLSMNGMSAWNGMGGRSNRV